MHKLLLSTLLIALGVIGCVPEEKTGPDQTGSKVTIPKLGATSPTSYTNMKLVWADEFDGTALNSEFWSFETGNGSNGWGNNELQYYTDASQNIKVEGGMLKITAIKESYMGSGYTSARILTKGKFEQKYGRMEARIKMPQGVGTWPAFWMLGGDLLDGVPWPECGEIDIMEFRGDIPDRSTSAIHGPTTPQGSGLGAAFLSYDSLSNGYHTYAIEWKKNSITFIVDGRVTGTYSSADTGSRGWVYNQKFFLILNLAMGGTYAGEYIDPMVNQAQLHVDYIRFYSVNGVGKVFKG